MIHRASLALLAAVLMATGAASAADADTQAVIYRAHQDAIDLAIGWAERNVIFTRTGAGGAVQEEVRGVVAAAFDHWDSRAATRTCTRMW